MIIKRVSLAELLHSDKIEQTAIRISLTNKSIDSIGRPNKLFFAQNIILSNNLLTHLCGIQHFQNIVFLSLSDNRIQTFSQLKPLADLPRLQKLNLKGNSVTNIPVYRHYLVHITQALIQLDGKLLSIVRHKFSEFYKRCQNVMLQIIDSNQQLYAIHRMQQYISFDQLSKNKSLYLGSDYQRDKAQDIIIFDLKQINQILEEQIAQIQESWLSSLYYLKKKHSFILEEMMKKYPNQIKIVHQKFNPNQTFSIPIPKSPPHQKPFGTPRRIPKTKQQKKDNITNRQITPKKQQAKIISSILDQAFCYQQLKSTNQEIAKKFRNSTLARLVFKLLINNREQNYYNQFQSISTIRIKVIKKSAIQKLIKTVKIQSYINLSTNKLLYQHLKRKILLFYRNFRINSLQIKQDKVRMLYKKSFFKAIKNRDKNWNQQITKLLVIINKCKDKLKKSNLYIKSRFFKCWKLILQKGKTKRLRDRKLSNIIILRRVFLKMRAKYKNLQVSYQLNDKASLHSSKRIKSKAFKSIIAFISKIKVQAAAIQKIKKKFRMATLSVSVQAWFVYYKKHNFFRNFIQSINKKQLAHGMSALIQIRKMQTLTKQVTNYLHQSLISRSKNFFVIVRQRVKTRGFRIKALVHFRSRKMNRLKRISFQCLFSSSTDSFRLKIKQLYQSLRILSGQVQQSKQLWRSSISSLQIQNKQLRQQKQQWESRWKLANKLGSRQQQLVQVTQKCKQLQDKFMLVIKEHQLAKHKITYLQKQNQRLAKQTEGLPLLVKELSQLQSQNNKYKEIIRKITRPGAERQK